MSLPKRNPVQFDRIHQPSIQKYLLDKDLRVESDFDSLTTTRYRPSEKDSYLVHTKDFMVEADIDTVWSTYLSIPPKETWKSKMVSFGCMYSKKNKDLSYIEDKYDGLVEGQILFLNIRLFWGLVNIAVAHQIIRIDTQKKTIEFSYIKGGKTEGSQILFFKSLSSSATQITHQTTYRGITNSPFREKVLYPFLHGRVISAFHRNVKQKILLNYEKKK